LERPLSPRPLRSLHPSRHPLPLQDTLLSHPAVAVSSLLVLLPQLLLSRPLSPLPPSLNPLPPLLHPRLAALPHSPPTAPRLTTVLLPLAMATALLAPKMALSSASARLSSVFATVGVQSLRPLPPACPALAVPSSRRQSAHSSSLAPTSTAVTALLASSKAHVSHGRRTSKTISYTPNRRFGYESHRQEFGIRIG
jgi:hypothetical protein